MIEILQPNDYRKQHAELTKTIFTNSVEKALFLTSKSHIFIGNQ